MAALVLILLLSWTVVVPVMCECYFPVEMQGEFSTQWKNAHEITYTSLSLTYNSVPGWGTCHSKHRENIILRDTEMMGGECFRCIRIVQRSINVNQVHARDLNMCFFTEQEAFLDCPQQHEVRDRRVEEIMLYKTRGFYGEPAVTQVHCPFSGVWKLSYSSSQSQLTSCRSERSEAGGCPGEYMLDLKFRNCDFPDFDMSFQCLGDWTGEDGLSYLSLLDMKLPQLGEEPRPRYRCAVYKADSHSKVIHLALSNDSTCVNQLDNHLAGYETLKLEEKEKKSAALEATGRYPVWAQGVWGKVSIHGSDLTYKSAEELTTYHAQTLISPTAGKYLSRIETACGELGYACIALELRNENILEMKIGKIDSAVDMILCSQENMEKSPWVTVAKETVITPCPLSGSFTGVVPDAEGLCTRSSTSCSRPDLMEYQVYSCENITEVYEDRLYQCFGQFEDEGLTYTFTRRLDLPLQECFVGTTVGPAHFIMEAGAHCQRGKDPSNQGMVMTKAKDVDCDSVEYKETSTTADLSRPVSPKLVLEQSITDSGEHLLHGIHRNHNRPHHRSRGRISSSTPAAKESEEVPFFSGQDIVHSSLLTVIFVSTTVLLHC